MADLRVAPVRRTNNYDKFKHLDGNRRVLAERAAKIKKSIQDHGYILSPIIVNEKFEIIDGQGRHQALKELGLPIDYIVVNGAGLKECVAMNLNQSNWKTIDFIRSYAEQGKANYQALYDCIVGSKLTISVICAIATNQMGGSGTVLKQIAEGTLPELDKREITDLCERVEKFIPFFATKGGHVAVAYCCLAFIIRNKLAKVDELLEKCEKYSAKIETPVGVRQVLENLESIYNYRSREKAYFVHAYDIQVNNKI